MDRVNSPALRGSWLGRVLRLAAPAMRVILGSPLHPLLSRWFMLLSWAGPRTGQWHTIPVSFVEFGGAVYATTGDRWWRSVMRSPDVRILRRGRQEPARPAVPESTDESVRTHYRIFKLRRHFRRLAGIPATAGGEPDEAAIRRAVRAGRTLLRFEPLPRATADRAQ